jgi:hypothetical protein
VEYGHLSPADVKEANDHTPFFRHVELDKRLWIERVRHILAQGKLLRKPDCLFHICTFNIDGCPDQEVPLVTEV